MNIGSIPVGIIPPTPHPGNPFSSKITAGESERRSLDAFLPLLTRMVSPTPAWPPEAAEGSAAGSPPPPRNGRKSTAFVLPSTDQYKGNPPAVIPSTAAFTAITPVQAANKVPKIEVSNGFPVWPTATQNRRDSFSPVKFSGSGFGSSSDSVYVAPPPHQTAGLKSEILNPDCAFGLRISPQVFKAGPAFIEDMPPRSSPARPAGTGAFEVSAPRAGEGSGEAGPKQTQYPQETPEAVVSPPLDRSVQQTSAMVLTPTCGRNSGADLKQEPSADGAEAKPAARTDSAPALSTVTPATENTGSTGSIEFSLPSISELNSSIHENLVGHPAAVAGQALPAWPGEQESESVFPIVSGEKSSLVEHGQKKAETPPGPAMTVRSVALPNRPPQSAATPARSHSEAPPIDLAQEDSNTADLSAKSVKLATANLQTLSSGSGNPNNDAPQLWTLGPTARDGVPEPRPNPPEAPQSSKIDPEFPIQHFALNQSARQISFQLNSASSNNVNVVFVEKGGNVQVAVRTPDPNLAKSLQTNLTDLVARLGEAGLKTQVYLPASSHHAAASNLDFLSAGKNQGDPGSRNGSAAGQQQDHNGSNKRQQSRWRAQMEETLSSEEVGSDVR